MNSTGMFPSHSAAIEMTLETYLQVANLTTHPATHMIAAHPELLEILRPSPALSARGCRGRFAECSTFVNICERISAVTEQRMHWLEDRDVLSTRPVHWQWHQKKPPKSVCGKPAKLRFYISSSAWCCISDGTARCFSFSNFQLQYEGNDAQTVQGAPARIRYKVWTPLSAITGQSTRIIGRVWWNREKTFKNHSMTNWCAPLLIISAVVKWVARFPIS